MSRDPFVVFRNPFGIRDRVFSTRAPRGLKGASNFRRGAYSIQLRTAQFLIIKPLSGRRVGPYQL